ncbi:MAG: Lipoprotein LpqB, GerMN domain [Clostridia bacterium]|jgi:germination protein M|nr:Lipoprotein LpqB, GerMN domain [Clostridia bacterium]
MKIRHTISLLLVLMLIPTVLAGCTKKLGAEDTIKVYFCDSAKGSLLAENVSVDFTQITTDREKAQFVINTLRKGSQSSTIQTNNDMYIQEVNLNERLAYVLFDKDYISLNPQEQIGIRSSLVYSLTELNFIDGVEFFVGDVPLTNISGEPIGPIERKDILINVLSPNPPTTIQTVTLYFAGVDNKGLVKEQRDIQVNSSIALEKYIIDELIKGPQVEGLLATIPKETTVNDVNTKEGVCQVDLSFDVKSKHFATPESKMLMIYSIVNSLTELSKVQKVAFLIDGKKEIEFSKDIDLSEFFERKESIIE